MLFGTLYFSAFVEFLNNLSGAGIAPHAALVSWQSRRMAEIAGSSLPKTQPTMRFFGEDNTPHIMSTISGWVKVGGSLFCKRSGNNWNLNSAPKNLVCFITGDASRAERLGWLQSCATSSRSPHATCTSVR